MHGLVNDPPPIELEVGLVVFPRSAEEPDEARPNLPYYYFADG